MSVMKRLNTSHTKGLLSSVSNRSSQSNITCNQSRFKQLRPSLISEFDFRFICFKSFKVRGNLITKERRSQFTPQRSFNNRNFFSSSEARSKIMKLLSHFPYRLPTQYPTAIKLSTVMQPCHDCDGVSIIIMKFLPWQLSTFIAFHRGRGRVVVSRNYGDWLGRHKKSARIFSHAHLSDEGTIKNFLFKYFSCSR